MPTVEQLAAQRNVAFAKYFERGDEIEKLLRLNGKLEELLVELCFEISECEAVVICDPEGDLVRKARSILASLALRPRGAAAITRFHEKHPRRTT